MKKLLFISLLISVPAWGMEVESDELVTEIYYKVDKNKEQAFEVLQNQMLSESDEGYEIIQQVKQAETFLSNYLSELAKEEKWLWKKYKIDISLKYGKWNRLTVQKKRKATCLSFCCGCGWVECCCCLGEGVGITCEDEHSIPFSYQKIKDYLEAFPSVTKVRHPDEHDQLKERKNDNVRKKSIKNSLVILKSQNK